VDVDVAHIMIPTRDGTRLAANLFRPVSDDKVPAVVEYTPYRKDDLRGATRDFGHFYLAARSIASVQLDVRGTGGSEGTVIDEYQHPQEQEDGYDALEWLARQAWCNGRTGMWGQSYAGFTALQVAQLQPRSLGAIAPMYATDDRYTDDMHFRGGALHGWSVIGPYALGMISRNALPPYPEVAGEHWKALWDQRLRENIPWVIRWIEEQLDGDYWRSTLGRRYESVQVPTLTIAGWADFYANAAIRWFQHLRAPKKLIMGPWPHTPPDAAVPGPRIDFMHEVARWFTEFLTNQSTGILDEPPVTVFVQANRGVDDPSKPVPRNAPGYWRFDDRLPPASMIERTWYLGAAGELDGGPAVDDHVAERQYVPFVGFSDLALAGGGAGSGEQAGNEPFSVLFTSKPLTSDTQILGFPRVTLFASSTAEVAFFAVRLCDVAPSGSSTLVSKGLLNGTRRESMAEPVPMKPGEVYKVTFELDAASWVFPKGHRIRVAISGADFPEVWPSPLTATIRVHNGPSQASRIMLPVLPAETPRDPQPAFLPAPQRVSRFQHATEGPAVTTIYDAATDTMTARRELGDMVRHPDGVTVITSSHCVEMSVSTAAPAEARAAAWDQRALRRPGLDVQCTATAELQSTIAEFHLRLDLDVRLNGSPYWRNRWVRAIPRRLL
jgi:uncharacterized protein